ncbi:MAG: hypothetical protein PHT25_06680 [Bacteroidales bacterium]|nr:hypothetical protein [Bacteroidales bacterium]
MEQKDYILREIEKIAAILGTIRQKLFGGSDNLSLSVEKQFEDTKDMLLNDAGFDLEKFMSLDKVEGNAYLSSIKGFSIDNIELLAECVAGIGSGSKSDFSRQYYEKALQLYQYCNDKSKTFSLEREEKIEAIKNRWH